jgi:hypothetical protein
MKSDNTPRIGRERIASSAGDNRVGPHLWRKVYRRSQILTLATYSLHRI